MIGTEPLLSYFNPESVPWGFEDLSTSSRIYAVPILGIYISLVDTPLGNVWHYLVHAVSLTAEVLQDPFWVSHAYQTMCNQAYPGSHRSA